MADNTGRAGVRFEGVTISERVRIGDALRCEHQQQQDEPQAATDCEGSQVHWDTFYSRWTAVVQPERGFQLHDLFHVLIVYDTNPLDEFGVVSFTAAQTLSPCPTVIMTSRPLQMVLYEPELLPFVMDTVVEGWSRGRRAAKLVGIRWENHWAEPLHEVRQRHRLLSA